MIGTLVWKEYREHRAAWLAVTALALLLSLALRQLLEPAGVVPSHGDKRFWLVALNFGLAVTYGLVCGALILAGEVEKRTLLFLDTLPSGRWRLWRTKFTVGLALVVLHVAALTGITLALGIGTFETDHLTWDQAAAWCMLLGALELLAFAWGLLFSARCQHVLTAAMLGGPVGVGVSVVWLILSGLAGSAGLVLLGGVLLFGALTADSARIFCGIDRERKPVRSSPRESALDGLWASARALWWLNWRQSKAAVVGIFLVALIMTLAGVAAGWFAWALIVPPFVTIVGVVCGVLAFFPEQSAGTFRFIGDQRIGAGTFWRGKVLFWGLVAIIASLPALASSLLLNVPLIRDSTAPSPWAAWIGEQYTAFLTIGILACVLLGLFSGFSIGQLLSLSVRTTIVALVIAVPLAVAAVAVWLPSLLMGGWHVWQLVAAPIVLLIAARLTTHAWINGQLRTGRSILRLTAFAVLALAALAGALAYRVVEIPDTGVPFNVEEYVASFPRPENNDAGHLIRRAGIELERRRAADETFQGNWKRLVEIEQAEYSGRVGAGGAPQPPAPAAKAPNEGAAGPADPERPQKLWTERDAEVGRWLDGLFKEPWLVELGRLPDVPMGMVVDPRRLQLYEAVPIFGQIHPLDLLLRTRARQLQDRGDYAGSLDLCLIALALSRQSENHALAFYSLPPQIALERWMQALGNQHPELLRRALAGLERDEAERATSADHVKAEYVMRREWLQEGWESGPVRGLVQAPWERERTLRMLNRLTAARLRVAEQPRRGVSGLVAPFYVDLNEAGRQALHGSPILIDFFFGYHADEKRSGQKLHQLRLMRLRLALALFAVEHNGKKPATLGDLVPAYLSRVPMNPFTGQDIQYYEVDPEGDSDAGAMPGAPAKGKSP